MRRNDSSREVRFHSPSGTCVLLQVQRVYLSHFSGNISLVVPPAVILFYGNVWDSILGNGCYGCASSGCIYPEYAIRVVFQRWIIWIPSRIEIWFVYVGQFFSVEAPAHHVAPSFLSKKKNFVFLIFFF